jgi:hypothetical protein
LRGTPIPREDLVKVERYILISRSGFSFIFQPSNTVYLLVPHELRDLLLKKYGIDLKSRNVEKTVSLVEESVEEGDWRVKLVYEFRSVRR